MKSLSEADIQQWIARTQSFLAEYQPGINPIGVYGSRAKAVPPELGALKIIRIDISQDQVRYVWMGGLDHTELEVHRLPDGSFTLIARYNDAKTEIIWPKASTTKKSSQAVERPRASLRSTWRLCRSRVGYLAPFAGLAVADLVSR